MRWWRVSPDCWLITPPLMGHSGQSEPKCQASWPMRARQMLTEWLILPRRLIVTTWASCHNGHNVPDICWTLSVGFHEDDFMFNPRQMERQKIYTNNCEAQSHPSPTLALSLLTLLPYPSTTSQVLSSLGSSLTLNVKPQRWPWDGVWNGLSIYPPTRKFFLSCSTL